ncbi:MAG: glycosyltransferase, partial [Micrococcales bacterium]
MGESPTRSRVVIDDVPIDAITAEQTVHTVMAELAAGRGGRIVTPNVDIMQAIRRRKVGPEVYAAELVVADGMPLLWAAQVRGTPLPERVTGASLVWDLSAAAA